MAGNLATFLCQLSENNGSLDLPEPLGPVQTFTGIAIPFLFHSVHSGMVLIVTSCGPILLWPIFGWFNQEFQILRS